MAFKLVALFATLAVASAGLIDAPGHLAYTGAQHYAAQPIAYSAPLQHATYSAPIVQQQLSYAAPITKLAYSPASSVSHASSLTHHVSQPITYSAPIVQQQLAYAAPIQHATYSAPIIQQQLTYAAPVAKLAYASAPAVSHSSSSSSTYHAPQYATKTIVAAQPIAYAAKAVYQQSPVYHQAPISSFGQYAAAPVVHAKTLAYSPAVAVSHSSFEGLGAHYQW